MNSRDSETTQRLQEASTQCLCAWETWCADKKQSGTRGTLVEALHDLRRVVSRLEIEMAIAEREDMAMRPIPIPAHRDARREGGQETVQGYTYDVATLDQDSTEEEDNVQPDSSESGGRIVRRRAPFRRRPASVGGGNQGNGNR